jgi:lipopolysaccharide export system permease protein
MTILTRYILREFTKNLALTLSAFVMLFQIGDFIEKVDDYIEHKAAVMDVVSLILYQLPKVMFLMTPVAVLLSTLLTIGMLSRNNEVVAMKASGIPLFRAVAPILAVAAGLSAVIFWANESVIPYCNTTAEYIKDVRIAKKPEAPALKHDKLWFRGPEGEIINLGLVEFKQNIPTCYSVTFYKLDDAFNLTERVDAAEMDWVDGGWVLKSGTVYGFGDTGRIKMTRFDEKKVNLPEGPEDFKRVDKLSDEMTYTELRKYITRLREKGYNPLKYVVDLYGKTSFTLANIIMVVVAAPFSLRGSRSGGMAVSVGVCVVIAISYWLIYSFSISLGHAGRFPPLFSAWVANLIFGFTGLFMYIHSDR